MCETFHIVLGSQPVLKICVGYYEDVKCLIYLTLLNFQMFTFIIEDYYRCYNTIIPSLYN